MSTDSQASPPRALIPPLFSRLVDDAAVFPPGNAAMRDAVTAHREYRTSWYAGLVGALLVPVSSLVELPVLLEPFPEGESFPEGEQLSANGRLEIGVVNDGPLDRLDEMVKGADARLVVRQVEAAVAKRGEDPQPGIAALLEIADRQPAGVDVYAEVPLTFGLLAGLDRLAQARAEGTRVAAKFRTGGLASELFPTPVELAAVICACRDRELPFKLTAGLHHAIRHTDPETGFTHHGFLNILVGAVLAEDGAEVADVAEVLAATDPVPLIEPTRARRDETRGLWVGFGSCSMVEPLTDLIRLGLVNGGYER